MIDLKNRYIRQGEFLGSDGENFIVSISEDTAYSLDAATYYIWSLCDGARSVEDIIRRVSEDLSLERSEVEQPVVNIIEALLKAELLREVVEQRETVEETERQQ